MNGNVLQSVQLTPAGGNDTIDASAAAAGHAVHFYIGSDAVVGGAGDDQIFTPNTNFASIDGGGGNDRLTLTTPGQVFNLTAEDAKIQNIEVLWLADTANTDVTLAGSDIAQVSASARYLYIVGGADDHVHAGVNWGVAALNVTNAAIAPGHTFTDYQYVDGSHLFVDNAITLDIVAGPTIPVDSNPTGNSVIEGAATGTPVGITAFSTDASGNPVVYSLSDDASGRFAINSATGQVTVGPNASLINFETAPNQAYSITVQSSSPPSFGFSQQTFSISVGDVAPGTPFDSDAATNTVAEGTGTAIPIGVTIQAPDVNGGPLTYSFADLGGGVIGDGGGRFQINSTTGEVSVSAFGATNIDYETAPGHAYSITVQATDGLLTSVTQTFSIAVSNVAPSTPVDGDLGTADSVLEGAAIGAYTGLTASSTDPNSPGSAVSYLLTDDAGGRFAINSVTGAVAIGANASQIDYETAPGHAYNITVAASDGTTSTSQTFSIAVANANPSTPIDSDGGTADTVTEGVGSGVYTGLTASSTDPNSLASQVTYSLTDDADGRFAINSTTGVVNTGPSASLIDFETAPGHAYNITVQASDGNGGSSSQTFAITVADVAPGNWSDANAGINTVVENASIDTPVGITAHADDVNGGTVTYAFASLADSANGAFKIDPTSGVVSVADNTKVDFEFERRQLQHSGHRLDGRRHGDLDPKLHHQRHRCPTVDTGRQ